MKAITPRQISLFKNRSTFCRKYWCEKEAPSNCEKQNIKGQAFFQSLFFYKKSDNFPCQYGQIFVVSFIYPVLFFPDIMTKTKRGNLNQSTDDENTANPKKQQKMEDSLILKAIADLKLDLGELKSTISKQNAKIDLNYKELKIELGNFKTEIDEIQKSQQGISDQFDDLSKSTQKIEKESKNLNLRVDHTEDVINCLEDKFQYLENKITDLQQEKYNASIAVHGVPASSTENLQEIVDTLMKQINYIVPANGILECFRVGFEKKGPIVLKMSTTQLKSNILTKLGKRIMYTDEIGINNEHQPIRINHYLSTAIKDVYKQAGSLRNSGFQFVWIKNGRILARMNKTSAIHPIYNQADIDRLKTLGEKYKSNEHNLTNKGSTQNHALEGTSSQ